MVNKPTLSKFLTLKFLTLFPVDWVIYAMKAQPRFRESIHVRNWRQAIFHESGEISAIRIPDSIIRASVKEAQSKFPRRPVMVVSDMPRGVTPSLDPQATIPADAVVIPAFEDDSRLAVFLQRLQRHPTAAIFPVRQFYPTARYFHRNARARQVLEQEAKAYPDKFALADYEVIIECLENTKSVPGDYVEIGVYKGGSARVAISYLRAINTPRKVWLLDTFDGFNYPEASASKDTYWSGSHTDTSLEAVQRSLGKDMDHVVLHACNIISNPLPTQLAQISVCNIDVDLYEAVQAALVRTHPLISQHGMIILEDQGHTPTLAGGWLAAYEFTKSEAGQDFIPIHKDSGQMLLIRK